LPDEQPDDILAMANSRVHAAHLLRGDLLDVLFPRGGVPPSEMLQVQVKVILQQLVLGIERALCGDGRIRAESWEALSMAALLREPGLVDFALARFAEARLREKLAAGGSQMPLTQLPAKLLGSDHDRLTELARALLDAEQFGAGKGAPLHNRLAPELLHQLCWRIVAALKPDGIDDKLVTAANLFLEKHDSDRDPFAVAEKLIFFLGPDYRDDVIDLRRAGLSLFVAGLARDTGLGCDRIVQLIDDSSPAPLMLLLRAIGASLDAVSALLATLGMSGLDRLEDRYSAIDAVEARAVMAGWREELLT
jgi:hypothetical protein